MKKVLPSTLLFILAFALGSINLLGNNLNDSFCFDADVPEAQMDLSDMCLTAPFMMCPATYLGCPNDNLDPSITGVAVATAGDASCPTPILSYTDVVTTNTACLKVVHRTWEATYPAGSASIKLHSTCQQTLYLEDTGAPTISNCPSNISINLANNCSGIATWVIPTAADDCGLLSFTTTHFSGTSFPAGNTTVTYTASDNCGQSSNCSFNVSVSGSCCTVPTITCPGTYFGCGGSTDPSVTGMAIGANADAATCGTPNVTFTDVVNSSNGCGTELTRTWTVSDANASASCIQLVNTTDNQIPVISNFPADMTFTGTGAGCAVPVTWNTPTAVDNCGIASFTSTATSGTTFNQGSTLVTYTAVDNCGNQTTAAFQVTVTCASPCSAPTINCPPSYTACPTSTIPSTSISGMATANAGGGCSGTPTVTFTDSATSSGNCANSQVVIRTFTATDANDGNLTNSCSQTINLIDTNSPSISGMPPNVTVTGTGVGCSVPVTWNIPTATDNCGVVSFTSNFQSGHAFPAGSTTVIYTAVDGCGNSNTLSFTVSVTCNNPTCTTSPAINCPATYAGCPTSAMPGPNVTGHATATSTGAFCSTPTVTFTDIVSNSGSCATSKVIQRTWTAVSSGLSSSCVQNINLVDNSAPYFTTGCPGSISLTGVGSNCSAVAVFSAPQAADNCGNASVVAHANGQVVSSGSTFGLGSTLVTYTASDACGNTATCAFNVSVACQTCNTNPTIFCPSSTAVCVGTNTSPSNMGFATASGGANCPTPTVTYVDAVTNTGNCAGSQVIERTWTAIYNGVSGYSNACTQTISVGDLNAPVFTGCPSSMTVSSSSTPVTWVAPTATDACAAPHITSTHNSGSTFPAGVTTVTYTATDNCGNAAQCSFTITVNQPQGGFANCPNDIVVQCGTSTGTVANWTPPTYNGACNSCDNGAYIPGFIYMGSYGGSKYYCSLSNATWPTANTICQSNGGHLADINSAGENAFLANILSLQSAWIGLTDVNSEGSFGWTSGAPLTYTNWYPGQPNNYNGNQDYVEMLNDGTWNDQYNNYSLEFIMELPCSFITQTAGPAPGTHLQSGTYPVTYTLQDACGSFATCSFKIEVESGLTISCPNNINVTAPTTAGVACTWNEPTSTSCCSSCSNTGGAIPGFVYMGSLNGSHYYCSLSPATWTNAQNNCNALGGNLAVVNSAQENAMLANFLQLNSAWIGCSDAGSEGNYQWVNGDPFTYSNWYAGQPNNYNGTQDYIEMLNTGEWNDQYGNVSLEYIMEVSNCITTTQTAGPTSGSVCPPGVHTVSYTVQDGCGNVESCSFTVTVTGPATGGGGNGNYCTAGGAISQTQYIHSCGFATIANKSGNNGGYHDFTNICTSVSAGSVYPLQLTPGFGGASPQKVYWTVWIDYNMDGDFNDNYEFVAYGCGSKTLSGSVTVPYAVWNGTTRMRVSMKIGGYSTDPCENFLYGETEDYCVTVTGADLVGSDKGNITLRNSPFDGAELLGEISSDDQALNVFPNPVNQIMTLQVGGADQVESIEMFNIEGKLVRSITVDATSNIEVSELQNGIYMLRALYKDGQVVTERVIVQH